MLQACAERRHRRCTARSSRGSPAHLRLMPHHPRRIECSPACEKCWTQSAIPSSPGPSPHLLHTHPRRASSPPHTTLHHTTPPSSHKTQRRAIFTTHRPSLPRAPAHPRQNLRRCQTSTRPDKGEQPPRRALASQAVWAAGICCGQPSTPYSTPFFSSPGAQIGGAKHHFLLSCLCWQRDRWAGDDAALWSRALARRRQW